MMEKVELNKWTKVGKKNMYKERDKQNERKKEGEGLNNVHVTNWTKEWINMLASTYRQLLILTQSAISLIIIV
jgi:hypothetical protein